MGKTKTEEKKEEAQAVPEAPAQEAQASAPAEPVPAQPGQAPGKDAEAKAGPALESLDVLADRHRVPGWQQAALQRYAGWADDKQVTDAEYAQALAGLNGRRIGGGRR